jgi:hypothetical protein
MRAFRVLTALVLAWIGLLSVAPGAPAKADALAAADGLRTVALGVSNPYPPEGVANLPATKLRSSRCAADFVSGIPSRADSATGTRLVRFGSTDGTAQPTGANGPPIEPRFRADSANAIRIGYSGGTGPQQSEPSAWRPIDPHHRLTTALHG